MLILTEPFVHALANWTAGTALFVVVLVIYIKGAVSDVHCTVQLCIIISVFRFEFMKSI